MLQMLGTYRIERKLADGGMGSVFLGRAPDDRQVVLKVPLANDREAAVALADEARHGARLRHPAIVETLDFFVDAGRPVLVVAYIDGPSLFDLRRAGPLPVSAVAEIGVQLAGALHAIHTAKDEAGRPLSMLHRDVSPNNVLVDRQGQVHLIDLGIARSAERRQKATLAGMVKGTLRYLAPEILQGGEHDVGSDLWALGLTLWEAALARYAIAGDPMNTMRAAMETDGQRPGVLALRHDERVDDDLLDVIRALVCPAGARLQNARAASAVLARLVQKHRGGRAPLAEAVAVVATALIEDDRTDNVDITGAGEFVDPAGRRQRELVEATAQMAREEDVAAVFTSTSRRDQIAAATLQMAAAQVSPVKLATAATVISLPASTTSPSQPSTLPPTRGASTTAPSQASTTSQPPELASTASPSQASLESAPTQLAMPRFPSAPPGAASLEAAATQVQMPRFASAPSEAPHDPRVRAARAPVPLVSDEGAPLETEVYDAHAEPSVDDAIARGLEVPSAERRAEPDLETAATIQMPTWTPEMAAPALAPRKPAGPLPSLFLPIVVVDDDSADE